MDFNFLIQYLASTFPIVDENIREAMGDTLYQLFMVSLKMKGVIQPLEINQKDSFYLKAELDLWW